MGLDLAKAIGKGWQSIGNFTGLNNPGVGFSRKAEYLWGDAPKVIGQHGAESRGLIDEQFSGNFLQQMEMLAKNQWQQNRQSGDRFSANGMAPSVFMGQMLPQQQFGFAQLAAAARGQSIAGRAQALQDLSAQITSALNQSEAFYKTMRFNNEVEKQGAKLTGRAQTTSMVNSAMGAAGSMFAGM